MKPDDTEPRQTNEPSGAPAQSERADDVVEREIDWNTENAAFVAFYNDLVEAEGVALEEYRLF